MAVTQRRERNHKKYEKWDELLTNVYFMFLNKKKKVRGGLKWR